MNKQQIEKLYKEICKQESLKPLPIKFVSVGKAGACLVFNNKTMSALEIQIDLRRCTDPEYALYHEIAHQVCLEKYKDPGHGAKFKKEFNRINDKYMYSALVGKIMSESKMTIKEQIKQIIKEEIISTLTTPLKITTVIDKSYHAGERQSRHDDNPITDEEIIDTVNLVMPKITKMFIFNKLDVGNELHIHDNETQLNIIGVFEQKGEGLQFTVITVMFKRDFKAKPGTKTIYI